MGHDYILKATKDYELLDTGEGYKLERYGSIVLSRPDPQALWQKSLSEKEWANADAVFTRTGTTGKWKILKDIQDSWRIALADLNFSVQLLPSKHLGIFPEQVPQWKWLSEKIQGRINGKRTVSVLNLFAYTGGATLTCVRAGASVCHVDSSKFAVDLAHLNLQSSGLGDKPVRFIVDDVRKFVEREIKRGNTYDVILMDPPVYGKGVKDEVWKIEEGIGPLLSRVKDLLSTKPLALVLNGYASIYSHRTYAQLLAMVSVKGEVSSGEFLIEESSRGRLLPAGIYARCFFN